MFKRILPYFILTLIVLGSTLFLWLPFLLRLANLDMLIIYKNYDGPLYIIPAKTFYNPSEILKLPMNIDLPVKYFTAHLPLYPLFIRLVKEIGIVGGYLRSMIFVNLVFTIFLACFFYHLLKHFKLTKNPLLLVTIFLFLPRFLVVRSVGAPESLFIFLILTSLYFFEKEKYLLSGLFGGLAVATKTPGILLFFAYFLVLGEKWLISFFKEKKIPSIKIYLNYFWILLIPLFLLVVFYLYWRQLGDFFAYFNSGDNIHLVYPFSVFNFQARWVETAWLEEVIFYFFLYLLAIFNLKNSKYRSLFYFSLVFFLATTFIQHRDIARYSLPLWPMAVIASETFFTSKKFLIALIILLPAIYLYAWNFLLYNVMPFGDWRPFL